MRRLVLTLALTAGASGCAQTPTVGPLEAVELLVLDGVGRPMAECIVGRVDDLSLAKVTGIDRDISDDELRALATATAACRELTFDGGIGADVVGGVEVIDPIDVIEVGDPIGVVNERVRELITGGLELGVAECLQAALVGAEDPLDAVNDADFLSDAVRLCGQSSDG